MYNFNDDYFFVKEETTNALKELQDLLMKVSYFTDKEQLILSALSDNFKVIRQADMNNQQLKKEGLKRCNVCGEIKPLTEFYSNGSCTHSHCKECYNARRRKKNRLIVKQAN